MHEPARLGARCLLRDSIIISSWIDSSLTCPSTHFRQKCRPPSGPDFALFDLTCLLSVFIRTFSSGRIGGHWRPTWRVNFPVLCRISPSHEITKCAMHSKACPKSPPKGLSHSGTCFSAQLHVLLWGGVHLITWFTKFDTSQPVTEKVSL